MVFCLKMIYSVMFCDKLQIQTNQSSYIIMFYLSYTIWSIF